FLLCTNLIREKMPDAGIGTDIMVGFPGETDREFENSFNLVKGSALTYFHVFPYSRRKGTPADTMPNQVHPRVIKERSRLLRELGSKKKGEFYRGLRGTTPNYMSVRILDGDFKIGDEVDVEIRGVRGEEALGMVNSQYLK